MGELAYKQKNMYAPKCIHVYRHYNSTIPISISHPIIYGTAKECSFPQDKGKVTVVDSFEGDRTKMLSVTVEGAAG